jgi:hypothetical protein
MQNRNFGALRRLIMGALAVMMVTALMVGVTASHPTAAQEATATPSDPTWRGLGAARAALEEKFNTDLTYVRAWTFAQTEWKISIDECDEEVGSFDYRPVYYGWEYVITALSGRTWRVNVSYDLKAVTICTREESATVGAGGAPVATNPDLPAPVAGSGATGNFELGAHIFAVDAPAITAMQTSGMTWMKFQVRYDLGEGPEEAAGLINAAKSNGFKVLLSIVGHSYDMGDYEAYIPAFASYLGQVAAAGPDAIEVWNEPNLDREWPIGKVSGSEYTRMLAASFNAIKAANPAVIVISAAPSPTGFAGTAGCVQTETYHVCNDDFFFQQMAEAGAANYMDCVGSHYNEGIIAPSATTGDPRDGYPTRFFGGNLSRARAYISNRPICLTEIGYVTPEGYGPIAPGFAWGANTTVAQQAAWLAEAASISAGLGYVRLMIVWNVNAQQYNENDPQAGYAIIRPGGSCPACTALGTVMGQ